jgi:small subunit ribosomal protein S15
MVLAKEKKAAIMKKHKINEGDTGSADVQIALLTERIHSLVEHLKTNKKDQHSRRGLLMIVGKRKRLLNYLEQDNKKRFVSLVKELDL